MRLGLYIKNSFLKAASQRLLYNNQKYIVKFGKKSMFIRLILICVTIFYINIYIYTNHKQQVIESLDTNQPKAVMWTLQD